VIRLLVLVDANVVNRVNNIIHKHSENKREREWCDMTLYDSSLSGFCLFFVCFFDVKAPIFSAGCSLFIAPVIVAVVCNAGPVCP